MTISAVERYWRVMAQMMNSHKLLIGEPKGKTRFDCEDKIETAAKGIGRENVVWMNVESSGLLMWATSGSFLGAECWSEC